jgi:hypothetical protein
MKLYTSGISDAQAFAMVQRAGVKRLLVDPAQLKIVESWTGPLALDSGAYRAYKTNTTVGAAEYVETVQQARAQHAGHLDWFVTADIIDDPERSFIRWQTMSETFAPRAHPIPVWQWPIAPKEHLAAYLDASPIVGIGGLVPWMRNKDVWMLREITALCKAHPDRFHIFGINWLKAIEGLREYAHSGDTSKWLDGARYGHVVFVNTKTQRLSQAPAKVIPEYAALDRAGRCALSAQTLDTFCNG